MPTRGTYPCTVFTFERNSAATLEKCLQSGLFCAEHLLLDGGSTDGTFALAERYLCRVVPQERRYVNEQGRIIDYAGITNQCIAEARFPWVVSIDADEHLDPALMREIQMCVERNVPGVYLFQRFYTLNGRLIRRASSYPNYQIRLFHRDAVEKYVKRVHEKAVLRPGFRSTVLPGILYVPLDPLPDLRRKYRWYVLLEAAMFGGRGWVDWLGFAARKCVRVLWRVARILWIRVLHPFSGDVLPLRYEWINIWYAGQVLLATCPFIFDPDAVERAIQRKT